MDKNHAASLLYVIALIVGGLGLIFTLPSITYSLVAYSVAGILSIAGISIRYSEKIKLFWQIWTNVFKGIAFSLLHVFLYFFSRIQARDLVAKSIGLPVKDFDTTVHIFSIFFYLPTAILTTALFLYFCVFPTIGLAAWHAIKSHTIKISAILMGTLFHKDLPTLNESVKKSNRIALIYLGDMAGLIFLALLLFMAGHSINNELSKLDRFVRVVAYTYDYQPCKHYPGFSDSERVVFHDGGVISIAVPQNSDTTFKTEKLSQ